MGLRIPASACVFALLMATSLVRAELLDFDKGVRAAEAGNYAEAYCIWKPLAEHGHANAQYRLGWLYAKGLGLAVNGERALQWWRSAAELGHADAQFSIGWALHHGEGVKRDISAAIPYYLQASRNGNEDATEVLLLLMKKNLPEVEQGLAEILSQNPKSVGRQGMVAVGKANVRNGPNKSNKLLTTLSKNDPLVLLGRKGNWVRVWVVKEKRFGWIFHRLITSQEKQG